MRGLAGISPEQSLQENVTRSSLVIVLMIMSLMPLPFCCWAPMGWLAYGVYLIPMYLGLAPLRSAKLCDRPQAFHYLMSGTLIVVACSVTALPHLSLPFFFVLLSLYIVYWQLEKRLYAIRLASREYKFLPASQKETHSLVKQLVASSFKKALLPTLCGTLSCASGLLPFPAGGCVLLATAFATMTLMHRQLSLFR